eukprot:NODE_1323_length_2520_cov_9.200585.p1 GENE.NODE_1323_length_2520_cov_9.200585~~NODE_1323_length_2520_cov_9.200585.p1  ORF type:complete len:601 (-),score=163.57 NODE_1323_length_2520_cov_9.200585:618-2420(-)
MGPCATSRPVLAGAPIYIDGYCDYTGPGPWFGSMPDAVAKQRLAATGPASMAAVRPRTLIQALYSAASIKGNTPAFRLERPLLDGAETYKTLAQVVRDIEHIARAMLRQGFRFYESLNVWGYNAPEWVICIFAASFAGGKVAGIFPTDSPATAAFKVIHSNGSIVVVDDSIRVEGFLAGLKETLRMYGPAMNVKCLVSWNYTPEAKETVPIPGLAKIPIHSWENFIRMGAEAQELDKELEKIRNETKPGHCAALIYTAGTTGEPKAVMTSHDSNVYMASTVFLMLSRSASVAVADDEEQRVLSYLPLTHVSNMVLDAIMPLITADIAKGSTVVHFARDTLRDRLVAVRPTIFHGVPDVWEGLAEQTRAENAEAGTFGNLLENWAKDVGLEHARSMQVGGSGSYPLTYGLAESLVFKSAKEALGLDQCKCALTSTAPIRVETLEFFGSIGIHINEVYGLAECNGACTWSLDECHQWGFCGYEVPGVEVRCFKVEPGNINKKMMCAAAPSFMDDGEEYQGEICLRGRTVMMGYLANVRLGSLHMRKVQKLNHETIDSAGWLHTGDKGLITVTGMIRITGRSKELIAVSNGEDVVPAPIQGEL